MSTEKEFVDVITASKEKGTKAYDTSATVIRTEGSTAWVHIPGGVDETPVRMTMNAKEGDAVQVRVSGGTAFLIGNATSPPTDDAMANKANNNALAAAMLAEDAGNSATVARQAASQAVADAETARTAAETASQAVEELTDEVDTLGARVTAAEGDISAIEGSITNLQGEVSAAQTDITSVRGDISGLQSDVSSAQSSIQGLNGRITTAEGSITAVEGDITSLTDRVIDAETDIEDTLEGLALAQNIIGTLAWITAHSTVTTDTSPVSGKSYYIKNQDGTFTLVTDTAGKDPAQEGWYEMDEAMSNYVASHLALTNDGLYVTGDGSDWKVLIADDGVYIVDSSGAADKIVAEYSDDVIIGEAVDGKARTEISSGGMKIIRRASGEDTQIAQLGYGSGNAGDVVANAPFYSFGTRITGTSDPGFKALEYDPSVSYSQGEIVRYSNTYYINIGGGYAGILPTNTFYWRILPSNKVGNYSIAQGKNVIAAGESSQAFGRYSTALAAGSHAEGGTQVYQVHGDMRVPIHFPIAVGVDSHAENNAVAIGAASHAENQGRARGYRSHAEGYGDARGEYSHAEGHFSYAIGDASHAEGYQVYANGDHSHAQNNGTHANRKSQTAIGEYNIEDTGGTDGTTLGDYVLIIGNGNDRVRSNALTVDWSGNVWCDGDVENGSGDKLSDKMDASGILDMFYPVGCYYHTSDGNFDPNTRWGGTWSRLGEGQVLLSAGSNYTAGQTYGNSSPTLTDDQILHGHTASGCAVTKHSETACTRTTGVGLTNNHNVSVTWPTYTAPSHSHAVGSGSNYFLSVAKSPDNAVGRRSISPGSGSATTNNLYCNNGISRNANTDSGGNSACTRGGNPSVTVSAHGITQPEFKTPELTHTVTQPTISQVGSASARAAYSTMQASTACYIWHRTA